MSQLHTHFTPHQAQHRPCWHCTRFGGLIYEGTAARCSFTAGPRVRSMPEHGCSSWQRAVGADDGPDAVPADDARHAAPDRPRID